MISIIVVTHNSEQYIRPCLSSVLASKLAELFEVIVVDNDSSDSTPHILENYENFDKRIRCYRNKNVGFGAGVNCGINKATGRHLVVLNPDTVVDPDCLMQLSAFLDAHPKAGAAAPRLINDDGSVQNSCRRVPSLLSILGNRSVLPRVPVVRSHTDSYLMADKDYGVSECVPVVLGACFAVKREAFAEIGGFNERYFLYFEDVELCCQLWRCGWEVWYLAQADVQHKHVRASVHRLSPLLHHVRSAFIFYCHYPEFLLGHPKDVWSRLLV